MYLHLNLRHYDHDGRARFVTFNSHRNIPVFTSDIVNQIVVDTIFSVCRERRLRLLAYVVMPEHVHVVLVPPLSAKLGPIIGEMKFSSAMKIHELLNEHGSPVVDRLQAVRDGKTKFCLWQRRCYDRNCRTEAEVWEKVTYCHNNPVRRGLVRRAEDWRWSSYCYYQRSDNMLLEIDLAARI